VSKILRGGRLSSARADVSEFTSSIKDDARLLDAIIQINQAHVIMLAEQKIIGRSDAAKLLKALEKNKNLQLSPSAEDVHMAVEETVLKETGPEVGGNLHIGKSRNDQVATAIRMQLRKELLKAMALILQMQENLLDTAEKHVNTVILEYTHLQPAQPVTFAHYILSYHDALERDLQRLKEILTRVNMCPLGAGALATTSFPINRDRVADLLGFSEVLENSIDAVGSRDFILETVAAFTIVGVNLSRFAEDLIVWSSPDFGVVELPDDFAATSSIMPQKKNPEVLEVIRARASHVLGDFVASASALKGLPSTYNLDFQEVTPKLWEAAENVCRCLDIFTKLLPELKVSTNVSEKVLKSFVGATELANLLVRKYKIPFRTAHKIVGALVKSLIDSKMTFASATPALIRKIALDSSGVTLNVEAGDIDLAIDPLKLVEAHNVKGGPAPSQVKKALELRKKRLLLAKTDISKIEERLGEPEKKLTATAKSYSVENGRLKNSKL
jgi:argininosuccinate lyase